MKGKVQLYTSDKESDLGYPVKIILSHNRKTRRKTIAHAKKKQWDHNSNFPNPSHPDYENLFDKVSRVIRISAMSEFKGLESFDEAFNQLQGVGTTKKNINFLDYGEERAKYMEQTGYLGNARAYRAALNELRKYQEKIYFKDLTGEFLHGFKEYKKRESRSTNSTLRAYLYAFKAIYTAAIDNGLIKDMEPFKKVFKSIPKTRRNQEVAYLEKSEIKKLELAEFDKNQYNRTRDLVLLQFYLGGLDFMDLCYLKKSKVRKDAVIIKRAKLGDKGYEFSILLPEKAKVLLNRYKGEDPVYWFDFPKGENAYILFRGSTYRYLKRIRKKLDLELTPIDGKLNLKTMRRSFRTIGKYMHTEEDILREIMGHERMEVPNLYQARYKPKERDQAHLRIIDTDFI